jgi:hypothetical protein
VYRGEIQHVPWLLQRATCQIERNTLTQPLGVELANSPTYIHFAKRLDVVAWYIRQIPNVPTHEATPCPK